MVRLARDVRSLLGPDVKLGYAADWSEYFGYTPQDGSGDHFFHLDPLWAEPEIDFIGIDNYMPLSDWREGSDHEDGAFGSIYNLDYLRGNVAGGEGFDWYYADEAGAEAQERLAISDGAYGEPWVFRYKDLKGWWENAHHDRIGGVRAAQPTAWVPRSKPFWFTEVGCAAIDKGANEPNKFLDPKSSELVLPRASTGARDDLMQMQYLRATFAHWADPAANPSSPVYGGRMVDMDRAHVWAWDARPYPWFPGLPEVWSDGDNYARGHWLNGRTSARSLASVVAEICALAGLDDVDVSDLWGLVRGYGVEGSATGRGALQPLMLAYGFEALERDGGLVFRNREAQVPIALETAALAVHPDQTGAVLSLRASESEMSGRVRLGHVASEGSYDARAAEAVFPGAESEAVAANELNLVLTDGEARAVAERWLAEARVARDTARFALPPSRLDLGPGDVIALPQGAAGQGYYRIDRTEQMGMHLVESVRVEPGVYTHGALIEPPAQLRAPAVPTPVAAVILDLPLLTGTEVAHAPHVAVTADPWPGEVAVYASATDADYRLNTLVGAPAILGVTQTPLAAAMPGLLDRGPVLRVAMSGALSSAPMEALLGGSNAMAIGDGTPGNWEVFQFQQADLVGRDTYDLSLRLRGQLGTDAVMPAVWPAGSMVVLLDGSLPQIDLPTSARGLSRHYRIGPALLGYDRPEYIHLEATAEGIGLRPYAPVHLSGAVSGDVHAFAWVRRTRIDGDLWTNGDVPLGEAEERYAVRIVQGGTLRHEASVTAPAWQWGAAERSAAGVTGAYAMEVAQLSDRFGPGPFRRMDFDANS